MSERFCAVTRMRHLSVVVLTFNCEGTIRKCLESIFNAKKAFDIDEVVVVDGGSKDKTLKIVGEFPTKIVANVKGRGPSREAGWREARNDLVCFFDSDLYLDPDWFVEIAKAMDKYPDADVWYGRVYTWNEDNLVAKMSGIEYSYYYDRIKGEGSINRYSTDTSNTVFRKSVLEKVNGFDTTLPYSEDAEIGHRIWRAGGKIVLWHEAKVYHYHRPSLRAKIKQNVEFGMGTAYILDKNPDYPQPWLMYALLPYSIAKLALVLGRRHGWVGVATALLYFVKRVSFLYGYLKARIMGLKMR